MTHTTCHRHPRLSTTGPVVDELAWTENSCSSVQHSKASPQLLSPQNCDVSGSSSELCQNCMNSTVQNEHVTLNCGFASWDGIYSASLMTMELEHTTVIHLGNQWPFQPGPKRLVSGVAKTRAQLFRWMDENTGIRGILTWLSMPAQFI
jgi:hypothetical protein